MSLITKIKESIEARGLNCIYDSLGMINQKLDYSNYPLAFFTLIKEGGLITMNNVYKEVANIAVFFVKPSTFDFESLENEQIIDECKTLALGWLDSLKWGGVLRAEVLRTDRLYNYADSILTGYALNLRISELEGEGCLNPLIPDSRKCEVILTSEEGGTVEGSGTYIINSPCTISATPDSSHRFSGWYIGEDLISTEPIYTFTITESGTLNISGKFEAKRLRITCNSNSSVILTNSNNETYTWNLVEGENIYTGNVEGFELNNIIGLKKGVNIDTSITTVDASDLTSWTTMENQAFQQHTALTSFIMPNSLITMGSGFFSCTSLKSITLSNSLTTIGSGGFQLCSGLESINFPNTLTSIGFEAFMYTSLVNVVVPASLTSIGGGAFQNCTDLESITFLSTTPPTMTGANAFVNTNDCPIYVPADSVNAYKTANRWFSYANRIQAITE